MEIIRLDSTGSTNSWVAQNEASLPSPCLVYCREQTAGRGQRGNSWESQPGMNVTASLMFHPCQMHAASQFAISEAIALAITDFLREEGMDAMVKWPNDIYVGDKKICGILVENVVTGVNISRTIAGFGININQTEFFSDAPNPVSLRLISGKTYDIEEEVNKISRFLDKYLDAIQINQDIHQLFLERLWRKEGFFNYREKKSDVVFSARIHDVGRDGMLTLAMQDDQKKTYAFKEVEFIL